MDLSVFKLRYGGSWRASKIAAFLCFLATGAILAATLLHDNGIAQEITSASRPLF